jgi:hypothetical protein
LPWPDPETPEALSEALAVQVSPRKAAPGQNEFFSSVREEPKQAYEIPQSLLPIYDSSPPLSVESPLAPADELFAKVRELLGKMKTPKTGAEVAADLHVSNSQAKEWLQRLVKEDVMEKHTNPVRYGPKSQRSLLE